ncbi:hypothetical protein Tco_0822582 [Tanacetum coccineum]|uniref:Uncharacterized protein n=1 Tax=Tanacetum coccineum TaxID=301880 RepID=A0ABQ5AJS0_9ASTR
MEMEPDIQNMTMNEYLEYEAAKERQVWDDVRSRRSPTNYNEADVDSFYRNKKFKDEILNVTMVDDEADFYPTKDLEDLERLLAKESQSNFIEIQIGTLYLLDGVKQRGDKIQGHLDS